MTGLIDTKKSIHIFLRDTILGNVQKLIKLHRIDRKKKVKINQI